MIPANFSSSRKIGLGLLLLLVTHPLMNAERPQAGGRAEAPARSEPAPRSEPFRAPAEAAPAMVSRSNHGSLRHFDANLTERPAAAAPRNFNPRQNVIVHHDVNAEVNHRRFWNGFAFGTRVHALRPGFAQLLVNNIPYFYDDGIYYQQADDGYQEVYPPDGAAIPQLPDGAIEIDAGGLTYYYAAGAFYVLQNGEFVIAPAPIGVTVPELPPGAVQVSIDNRLTYQFNGIYYQPVFVNGVTQYATFMP